VHLAYLTAMVHLAFFAPYCTTPHTQRSCLYSRAARTTDLLSGSTQPLTGRQER